jgi:rod shape determining protein RodA
MASLHLWRHFDYVLLVVTILLLIFGVVMIRSATRGYLDEDLQGRWRQHAIVGAAGVGMVFLLAAFPRDYNWLGDFWWLAFLLALVLLVLVLRFGESEIVNVRTWLKVGGFTFQPSFPAMILLAVSAGAIFTRERRKKGTSSTPLFGAPKTSLVESPAERPDLANYLISGLMMLVLAGLIGVQPDMATAGVLVVMWLAMLFESDVPVRYLVMTAVIALAAAYPLWLLMGLSPDKYMQRRVLEFFSPATGYQVRAALIAVGSGGLGGKGLGMGAQSQLRYLPARHTDFIFAILAEELGFVGVMLLFALYAVLFYRLLRIILIASDAYGRLLVTGVLAMILSQFAINVGMNLGLLPVAGLPLPFISDGSTPLLTTMVGVGLAENVVMRHRRFEF